MSAVNNKNPNIDSSDNKVITSIVFNNISKTPIKAEKTNKTHIFLSGTLGSKPDEGSSCVIS